MPSATPKNVLQRAGTEGPFRLQGTDVEVDSDSISSEWTSDSEDSGEIVQGPKGEKKRRRQIRTFRVCVRLDTDSEESSSSSSGSSSSTSSGSSSASNGEVVRQKRQRKQMQAEWARQKAAGLKPWLMAAADAGLELRDSAGDAAANAQPVPDVVMAPASPPTDVPMAPPGPPPPPLEPASFEWISTRKRYRCLALARGVLNQADIKAIHAAAHHPSVREINDRKGYLAFKHRVWRFEPQLRALCPELYQRLIRLMDRADSAKWRRLRRNNKRMQVYPEIEYISYDVAEQGEPCYIEPHVDNKSAVTMVAMLSTPDSYVGGRSCFRRSEGRDGCRDFALQQGDIVLFRGEKLSHWITPVTAGHRIILQIELSRV